MSFRLSRLSPLLIPVCLLIIAVAIYFIAPGCHSIQKVGQPDEPLPQDRPDTPFIFLHLTPSYSAPGQRRISGTMVAIYPDGKIIRATSEADIGKSYIRGRLTPAQIAQVRRMIDESGILSTKPDGTIVMHAAAEHLGIRYGKHLRTWAHTPGFEKTNPSTSNSRITKIKQELFAIPVPSAVPEPPQEWARSPGEWYR